MVKLASIDTENFDAMVNILEEIWHRRQARPSARSDVLYWELMVQYFQRIQRARDEGQPIVLHNTNVPAEVLRALGLVPLTMEFASNMIVTILKKYEEAFSVAKSYGLPPDLCSYPRATIASHISGWLPRPDIVACTHMVCDSFTKMGESLAHLYDVPLLFIDSAQRYQEKEIRYFAQEIEEMVCLLEKATGRQLDMDKLVEGMQYSQRLAELNQEIYELRQAIPYPMDNRTPGEMINISFLLHGTPEAVAYYEAMRDEVQERVERGEGVVAQERYRLISLFMPPMGNMKVLDWMQREHGAMLVASPYNSHGGEIEWDFSRPWETLARKAYQMGPCRSMQGPVSEAVLEDSVNDAISHKAQGAIFWAHIGCRQACSTIRIVKDALYQRAGILTLVLDMDLLDPSYIPNEEMKEKLEGFFELLEGRK